MKFSLLLWGLGLKFKSASKKSAPFRERLAEHDIVIQIRTADGRRGRYYSLKGGTVTSTKGVASSADLSLVWSDAATGFSTMKSRGRESKVKAITDGTLKLEGDASKVLWFFETIKQMMAV